MNTQQGLQSVKKAKSIVRQRVYHLIYTHIISYHIISYHIVSYHYMFYNVLYHFIFQFLTPATSLRGLGGPSPRSADPRLAGGADAALATRESPGDLGALYRTNICGQFYISRYNITTDIATDINPDITTDFLKIIKNPEITTDINLYPDIESILYPDYTANDIDISRYNIDNIWWYTNYSIRIWLVVSNMAFIFHIWDLILPIDSYFSGSRSTTSQESILCTHF